MNFAPEPKDIILLAAGAAISWLISRLQQPRGKVLAYGSRGQSVLTKFGSAFVQGSFAISFEGRAIPHLSVAAVTIWNAGDVAIDGAAIATSDPLRLRLQGDGEIVQAFVERAPTAANNVAVSIGESRGTADISFDFLNPGDGAIVRILHTSREPVAAVAGSIRDGAIVEGDSLVKRRRAIVVAARLFVMLVGMGGLVWLMTKRLAEPQSLSSWWLAAFMLGTPTLATLVEWIVDRFVPPAIPAGLRRRAEDDVGVESQTDR